MNKKQLEELYSKAKTEELIYIVYVHNEDYTEEALQAATAELKKRGISPDAESTVAIVKEMREKKEKEEKEIAVKSLTKKQKIWFTIFPGIAWWYTLFVFTNRKKTQRLKDANRCLWLGWALWFVIGLIIWLLIKKNVGG